MTPALLLLALLAAPQTKMERVRVGPEGKGFQLAVSGRPFTPWGFNYDHDEKGRLIEDYWESEWPKVEEDFKEMKELGATAVRIHLQVNRFMKAADQPNEKALAQLGKLLALAEETGLYLDLTGLGCYRKSDTPAWYEEAQEKERWPVQARFWEAVASACAKSPALLCYNLMNEPVSPAGPGKVWHGGEPLGGYFYVENLTRDPGKRSRVDVTKEWIATVSAGIRKNDPGRLVTAGMFFLFEVPAGLTLGPDAKALSEGLDYLSVHMYPKDASVENNLKLLATLKIGKPVIIEETFPLACSVESFQKFLQGSRDTASGWIGFYWGKTIEEYRAGKDL
ncbi:MAG: cellulase family glycosylhydrolase, partial [Planctomycetes bacterium]|nr:cellulase family glycosylhydrolase [Planctomycetota bacterium]